MKYITVKPTISLLNVPLLLLILIGASACSQNPLANKHRQDSASQASQSDHDKQISILDLKAIQPLDSISNQLGQHRVVFVGESHTDYGHHLNQLAIIKKTHQKWGGDLSIGLEMIQQPFQAALDDYIAGRINEREMLRKIEWYKRWKYDFRLYRPIFDYAKQYKIPLIALNISREVTMRVSKDGIKGLSQKDRALLPKTLDRSNKNYAARLKSVYSMHSHGVKNNSKDFENFYDAQLAWDEGMAFAAANYLKKHPKSKMVAIAGSGHLINREGIPGRLDRLLGKNIVNKNTVKTSAVILNRSSVGETPSSTQADYLLFSPDAKLPAAGLIGITMGDTEQGVKVGSVIAKGAAAKAGIKRMM